MSYCRTSQHRAHPHLVPHSRSHYLVALQSKVDSLTGSTGSIDFASVNATVAALDSALTGVDLTALNNAVTVLENWQGFIDNLWYLLDRTAAVSRPPGSLNPAGEYALLAEGYCNGNTQYYCSVDADCPSGAGLCNTAQAGKRRCSAGNQVTACDFDSQCGAGEMCLADGNRANDLLAQLLQAQAGGTPPDMSAVVTQLANLIASAGSSDPSAAVSQLTAAQASISGIDLTSATATLGQLQSSLGTLDVSSVDSTLADAQNQIAAVPWAQTSSQIDSVKSQTDNLEGSVKRMIGMGVTVSEVEGGIATEIRKKALWYLS